MTKSTTGDKPQAGKKGLQPGPDAEALDGGVQSDPDAEALDDEVITNEEMLQWATKLEMIPLQQYTVEIALAVMKSARLEAYIGGPLLDGHEYDGLSIGTHLAQRCFVVAKDFSKELSRLCAEERAVSDPE